MKQHSYAAVGKLTGRVYATSHSRPATYRKLIELFPDTAGVNHLKEIMPEPMNVIQLK